MFLQFVSEPALVSLLHQDEIALGTDEKPTERRVGGQQTNEVGIVRRKSVDGVARTVGGQRVAVLQERIEELLPERRQLTADELTEDANLLLHVATTLTMGQETLSRSLEAVAGNGNRRVEQQLPIRVRLHERTDDQAVCSC